VCELATFKCQKTAVACKMNCSSDFNFVLIMGRYVRE
jgi:hypothetical protein